MTTPTNHDITTWVRTIRNPNLAPTKIRTRDLEHRLHDIARRHRTGSDRPDGYPTRTTSDGTPHGTTELTATEAAAHHRTTYTTPDIDHHLTNALHLTHLAAHILTTLLDTLDRIDTLTNPTPPPGHTTTTCAEPHCDDIATPGHAGRCEPCYAWRRRHGGPDAPPVPRDIIAERTQRRTKA